MNHWSVDGEKQYFSAKALLQLLDCLAVAFDHLIAGGSLLVRKRGAALTLREPWPYRLGCGSKTSPYHTWKVDIPLVESMHVAKVKKGYRMLQGFDP